LKAKVNLAMEKNFNPFKLLIAFLVMFSAFLSHAQDVSRTFWTKQSADKKAPGRTWYPKSYQSLSLDVDGLKQYLATASMQKSPGNHKSDFIIELPMPDGSFSKFNLVESPIMAPELAAKWSDVKTYAGQGVNDRTASIRADITSNGFHAYILSEKGTIYIDPFSLANTRSYIIYYKSEIPNGIYDFQCALSDDSRKDVRSNVPSMTLDGQLRTYRLAMAADYEFCQFYSGDFTQARNGLITVVNRVIGIYERELAMTFQLVANNDALIYTNSNDPYNNDYMPDMLTDNDVNLNSVIGINNYDIGHVMGTKGGGLAQIRAICWTNKSHGATGIANPSGDPFAVDYVSHEIGHQCGANHPFNSTTGACSYSGQRIPNNAYEPGSGSTIMAYAGICDYNDLQPNSDAYFHTSNFDEIIYWTQVDHGNDCPVHSNPGNNSPTLTLPPNQKIPIGTAFKLTASGSDPDGDPITYCWEEWDLGPPCNWDAAFGNAATFRSFYPTANPTRIFPWLPAVLHDSTAKGELLPDYARKLRFRCTVRDNRSGYGGVFHSQDSMVVEVFNVDGHAFAITNPNLPGLVWSKQNEHTVVWDVAGTSASTINTPYVNIYLSTDGGYTFNDTIAWQVDNSGAYAFYFPDYIRNSIAGAHWDSVRLMVEGDGNIFFDINDRSFRIDNYDILQTLDSTSTIKFHNSLVPNDSYGGYNIHFSVYSAGPADYTVSIYDLAGKMVGEYSFDKKYEKDERYIDISNLASGLYFASFDLPDGKQTKKFVKAKYKQ
jgi:hypothetical protein